MKYFLLKLQPPRATFMHDMTPAEAKLMQEHAAYWQGLLARGVAVGFGVVADPRGPHGVGLVELADDGDPQPLAAADPVILANAGFAYEILPMPRATVRKSPQQLDAEAQMAAFEKDLKENDWGHQPC